MDNPEPLRGTPSWHEQARRWFVVAALVGLMIKSAWDDEPVEDLIIAVAGALFG